MPRDIASSSATGRDLEAGPQHKIEIELSEYGGAQTYGDGRANSDDTRGSMSGADVEIVTVPIRRVRALLRRAASEQYTPQIVAIGPYHVGQADSYLLQSTGEKNKKVQYIQGKGVDLEVLKALLSNLEEQVRSCYTHLPVGTMNNSGAFSEMLLLDACYLLCRLIDFGSDTAANQIGLGHDNTLVRDILYLLENQIPLRVLEEILKYICGTLSLEYSTKLIYEPVRDVLHQRRYISQNKELVLSSTSPTSKPSDLVHLVYSYFRRGQDDVPPVLSAQPRFLKSTGRWRRATDYYKYANLKFKCREEYEEGRQWTILDMQFDRGTLYIPSLQVNTDTCTMLRNLMALEEQEKQRPITSYCLFMSQVGCMAEDVRLLQDAGIIQHLMPNDEEAATTLASLCGGVVMDINDSERNYLKHLWHVLDKRCTKQRHNFMGFFREKHCSTVFYRLVFFVVSLTFLAEVTQAIYAVIAYHKPTRS